ncbi:putative mitochondrial protein [Phytophthora megakarya]|uniref:Putative mitochondrial protein n=1 Tax=Phytophthora megakarya TaxID=4795 RepID=A0A225VSM1_9STRA|nr:putative mitochondrial protein [Phytophthora megakarya]
MDPLDLLTGSFHTDSDPFAMHQEPTNFVDQEEKHEDNSSEDEPDQDMDFPTTQVLLQEPVDEEMEIAEEEQKPMSPVAMRSPVKPRNSPAKPRNSPAKVRSSPVKARSSPIKARSSPIKARSSPAKSPAKVRSSPGKVRSSPGKMRSPAKARSPAKPRPSPVRPAKPPVAPSPMVERLEEAEKEAEKEDETPEEFQAEGAEGKFTKVFPFVAKLVENGGWQIAQGMNTLFCAMPGVQFFEFKPNINVFDSKIKACWKFIQLAGEKKVDTEDTELWNMLWPIVEKEFGWFTMMCGVETWFVKPNTKFEHFLPNETVFQSKKRAVLKCLAVEVGDIQLGDSAEGHQVIAFAPRVVQPPAPKKVKTSLFKTPSPAVKSVKRPTPSSGSSTKFVTPAKRVSPGSSTSSAKRQLSSSSSKVSSTSKLAKSSGSKKVKGGKAGTKKTTSKKKKISSTASDTSKGDEFHFVAPEFKCSFGIVYSKLQDEGWYHKNGLFEYDYFSPTYTDATKEVNVNYFQSQSNLEDFLKVSGTWRRIEDELRAEHDEALEEERAKALERHHQRLVQQATRKRTLALNGGSSTKEATAPKPKKSKKAVKAAPKKAAPKKVATPTQSLYQAEIEAAQAAEDEESFPKLPNVKFGAVLKKLIGRGWHYHPGRFEYDYFKPGSNSKNAVSGEDRFESQAALEIYLKTTGLWEKIAEEIEHDELAKHDGHFSRTQQKRTKLASPPPSSAKSPKTAVNGNVEKEDVKAITNDIWANSHEFDFNE